MNFILKAFFAKNTNHFVIQVPFVVQVMSSDETELGLTLSVEDGLEKNFTPLIKETFMLNRIKS